MGAEQVSLTKELARLREQVAVLDPGLANVMTGYMLVNFLLRSVERDRIILLRYRWGDLNALLEQLAERMAGVQATMGGVMDILAENDVFQSAAAGAEAKRADTAHASAGEM